MKIHTDHATLHQGDSLKILPTLEGEQFTACVCDPPYHLKSTKCGNKGYMGKNWDGGNIAFQVGFWMEVLRVLKPGTMLLAFGSTRTFHRLMCAIEDAGFELRDCLMWIYGNGVPKSSSINLEGWKDQGTALKPAWEPITLAMKPFDGTFIQNAQQFNVAGLNIEKCRVPLNGDYKCKANGRPSQTGLEDKYDPEQANQPDTKGRWPANIIHDGSKDVVGLFPKTKSKNGLQSVSRFFYCAKASKQERTCNGQFENNHPTVKPLALMKYLCDLVTPPGGGFIIDPFMGSGTTGIGAIDTGNHFVGIELEPENFKIACQRIKHGESE